MRHNRTERKISEEDMGPRDKGREFLVASLCYSKGGSNYFTGATNQRGYSLHVAPEVRDNGFTTVQLPGPGLRRFLVPAKMFSAKKLETIEVPADILAEIVGQVKSRMADRDARRATA